MKSVVLMNSLVVGLIMFFNAGPAHAQLPLYSEALANDPYFKVAKITSEIKSIEEGLVAPEEISSFAPEPNLESAGVDPMAIAEIFFKVWEIIKDGEPVVNVKYKNVSALPNLANNRWETLTGWQPERTITFGVSTENLMGITTVDLEYKVKLLYGGRVNGKGRYIASARVVPTKVDVKWGYNLDVSVEVPSILNLSSQKDPLAAINLDVTYKISTVLRSYSESQAYELRGNGLMSSNGKVVYAASSR